MRTYVPLLMMLLLFILLESSSSVPTDIVAWPQLFNHELPLVLQNPETDVIIEERVLVASVLNEHTIITSSNIFDPFDMEELDPDYEYRLESSYGGTVIHAKLENIKEVKENKRVVMAHIKETLDIGLIKPLSISNFQPKLGEKFFANIKDFTSGTVSNHEFRMSMKYPDFIYSIDDVTTLPVVGGQSLVLEDELLAVCIGTIDDEIDTTKLVGAFRLLPKSEVEALLNEPLTSST